MAVEKRIIDQQIANLGDFGKWFTKKELAYLHEVMSLGETIYAMTSGLMNNNTWLVTVTDKRVIFLDKGMIYGLKQMELPLSRISAVSHTTGLLFGKIEVATAGGAMRIDMIEKTDVLKVAQIISALVNKLPKARPAEQQSCDGSDVVSQLERLAVLKNQGMLTAEEFREQKAKIIAQ
jgi:hypothetical protein